MNHVTRATLVLSALTLAAGACTYDWSEWGDWDREGFSCADHVDCAEGYECADAVCVSARVAVERSFPPDGAEDVHPGEVLRLVFTKPVHVDEVSAPGRFTLWNGAETLEVDFLQPPGAPEVVDIVPRQPFDYDRLYSATLSPDVRSTIGERMDVEYTWTFRASDAQWQETEDLSPPVGSASGPVVSANADLRMAAWIEGVDIVFRRWVDGAWADPERIVDTGATSVAIGRGLCLNDVPCLAWDSNGEILVRLHDDYWRTEPAGGGTGCSDPVLGAAAWGSVLLFRQTDGTQVNVMRGSWTNSTFVDFQRLNRDGTTATTPPIFVAAGEHTGVAWEEDGNTGGVILARSWIPVDTGILPGSLGIAVTPWGAGLVHWRTPYRELMVTARTQLEITAPEPIAIDVNDAVAAVGTSGGHLAYCTGSSLHAAPLAPQTGWNADPIPNTPPTLNREVTGPGSLRLVVDERGNAVLLWTENDDALYAVRYNARLGAWSAEPHRLDVVWEEEHKISDLDLVIDEMGRAVALWLEAGRVWAARFE